MQPAGGQGFYRSQNRIIGGVCAGIAENLHVDPLWVRLAFGLLAFAQGVGVLLYVILWVVMPERVSQAPGRSALDSMAADVRRAWEDLRNQFRGMPAGPAAGPAVPATAAAAPAARAPEATAQTAVTPGPPAASSQAPAQNWYWLIGVALVVIGVAFLASNTGLIGWSVIWPALLIAIGIVLLVRTLERKP